MRQFNTRFLVFVTASVLLVPQLQAQPDESRRPSRGGRGGPGGFPGGFGPFGGGRGGFNPFGGGGSAEQVAPEKLEFRDGVASIADHDTFHRLSYRGPEVLIDTYLADLSL